MQRMCNVLPAFSDENILNMKAVVAQEFHDIPDEQMDVKELQYLSNLANQIGTNRRKALEKGQKFII